MPDPQRRRLAAIMFTDIVGYTALMSKDEEKALQLLQRNRGLLKPIIQQFRGEWLKEMGDGTLSAFDSAVDAVNCALQIQHIFNNDPELTLRIGIHIGDVVFEGGDVFGDGVNVAARVEPLAEPGGVAVTGRVYDDIRNKASIQTTSLGEKKLKGVDHPIEVYSVSEKRAVGHEVETAPPKLKTLQRWLPAMAGLGVIVIIGLFLAQKNSSVAGGGTALREKSVAVLPFANFSDSKEDEYFSDGITEDILTHLSQIKDLKVIARTSVMQYKNTEKRIREIGRELGVATILEGSVRRAGDRIRIVGQLVDVATEEHLWAATYDRTLADVFAIQTDVAQQIAQALKAELLPEEQQRLEQRPTDNLEAYEFYLRGNDYFRRGSYLGAGNKSDREQAVNMYLRAIELDPDFALAYAQLSNTYAALYFYHDYLTQQAEQARQAVEQALRLNPNLPEAHLALGNYYNMVESDYGQALEAFSMARKGLLSNSELLSGIARVHMRQGQWDQALRNYQQAAELDPRSPAITGQLANILIFMRQYPEAEQVLNHAITLTPDNPAVYANKIELYLLWKGASRQTRQVIKEASTYMNPVTVMWRGSESIHRLGYWRFGLLDQEVDDVLSMFSNIYPDGREQGYYFSMAQFHNLAHRPELSRAYYDSVRTLSEASLSSNPDNLRLLTDQGLACAFLGLKDKALRAGKRGMELLPISACHW